MEKKQKVIKAYKGFNDKLQCRGFQYEIGKEYKTNGKISCCENGFHACQSPLEVLDYYFLLDNAKIARFCEVEQAGTIDGIKGNSTKVASSKIKINRELTFSELISLGIEWIKEQAKSKKIKDTDLSDNVEKEKKISSSGKSAYIASSGGHVQIGSSGYDAQIASSGDHAKIGSSGCNAQIASSGCNAKIASNGDYAKIASSGYFAKIGNSGNGTKIASNGDYAKITSSGCNTKIGSSGNGTKIASNGDYTKITSSGCNTKIGSSGKGTKIASNGDNAKIMSSGEDSLICCLGYNSIAKAEKGSWITLAEWVEDEKKNRLIPKCVKAEYVDGERIKSDTWYKLIDGEFTEIDA